MCSLVSNKKSIQYKFSKTILICFIQKCVIIKIVLLSEFTINKMYYSVINILNPTAINWDNYNEWQTKLASSSLGTKRHLYVCAL